MSDTPRNPVPTVDVLIETVPGTVVLIERKRAPIKRPDSLPARRALGWDRGTSREVEEGEGVGPKAYFGTSRHCERRLTQRSRELAGPRKNPPLGWAIPGGSVDYGEILEAAARREAREETGLEVTLLRQLYIHSDPRRDARLHTISTVFVGRAEGVPVGDDDAAEARVFPLDVLPSPLAFDHAAIIEDWRDGRY